MTQTKKMPSTPKKEYRVFAIYAEVPDADPIVYVGKSRMQDLRKLMRYYRNESELAKEFFEPGIMPELFLLEDAYMPVQVAYQHCIAWIRYFYEKDFDVIAHQKPFGDAFLLYGPAQLFYAQIMKVPIETVLQRRYSSTHKTPDEENIQSDPAPLSARLSIRLSKREYKAYSDFCSRHNITQRDGIQLLLANTKRGTEDAARVILEQKQHIQKLKDENAKLKKIPRGVSADKNLKAAFRFAQVGIAQYFYTQFDVNALPGEKMMCLPWDDFVDEFQHWDQYAYPTEDGYFCFAPEAMCYGKGQYSAIFLYGINCTTGERVKLRFYPRADYCGVKPPDNPFFVEGMCFFVGCRRIYPDVAEMVSAFPLVAQDATGENQKYNMYDESVEDMIRNATIKASHYNTY